MIIFIMTFNPLVLTLFMRRHLLPPALTLCRIWLRFHVTKEAVLSPQSDYASNRFLSEDRSTPNFPFLGAFTLEHLQLYVLPLPPGDVNLSALCQFYSLDRPFQEPGSHPLGAVITKKDSSSLRVPVGGRSQPFGISIT